MGWSSALLLLAAAAATEISLQPDPAKWQTRGDKAEASIEGGVLSVGPWREGSWSARWEYRERLNVLEGMVKGQLRTRDLYPRQAVVRIQFQQGEKSLSTRNYPLPASPGWRDFEVPIFRPPAGCDSVVVAFGLSEKTDGRVEFRNLRVSRNYRPPEYPAEPQLTRPAAPMRVREGPYVRVENHNNAWWLITPSGEPFFSIGTLTGSGNEEKIFEILQKLGFNSVAGSHNVQRWAAFNEAQSKAGKPIIYQFRTLETRVGDEYDTLVNAAGENPGRPQAQAAAIGGFNHAFPDPYDPRWQESFRKRVRAIAELVRGKTYFAAWFVDNEREHRDIHRYVWSRHCSAEFRRFLQEKYGGKIAALNRAWGSNYASFDDLMAKKPDPVVRHGPMYEDFRLFSREIIRTFNLITVQIIRDEDPRRLIFSNRFMLGEPRDTLENLDLYREFDAIAVNIYPSNIAAGLDEAEKQMLIQIHELSGKPIIIGEWSVPALDSGLYNNPNRLDWSYPQTVATQTQRARQAAKILADLYNLPFVIGAHWFTWKDYDSPVRQANRGLFKANDEPWTELQEALAKLHSRMPRPKGP